MEERSLFSSGEGCSDIIRQPDEYRTAFFTNLCCIAVPLHIFYVMCARELLIRLRKLEARCLSYQKLHILVYKYL
jgi:hypothetical protein